MKVTLTTKVTFTSKCMETVRYWNKIFIKLNAAQLRIKLIGPVLLPKCRFYRNIVFLGWTVYCQMQKNHDYPVLIPKLIYNPGSRIACFATSLEHCSHVLITLDINIYCDYNLVGLVCCIVKFVTLLAWLVVHSHKMLTIKHGKPCYFSILPNP